jgi:hypothetical protein
MAISEKIELLGKGLYKEIPDVLTLKAIPTASELDYVGSEDFQATMLDNILPKAVEEKIDFRQLLEMDFQWICRCLRLINYGYYFTTNAIYCPDCDQVSNGEFQVDLRAVEVKPLPENFTNNVVIPKDEFLDFNDNITIRLLTIQDAINASKDPLFKSSNGEVNLNFARLCYMITAIGSKTNLTAPEVKFMIQNRFSDADYKILKGKIGELTDYGLRAGGKTRCPKCGSREAAFIALVDDRFFRPSLGDLRQWKADRLAENNGGSDTADSTSGERSENLPRNASAKV